MKTNGDNSDQVIFLCSRNRNLVSLFRHFSRFRRKHFDSQLMRVPRHVSVAHFKKEFICLLLEYVCFYPFLSGLSIHFFFLRLHIFTSVRICMIIFGYIHTSMGIYLSNDVSRFPSVFLFTSLCSETKEYAQDSNLFLLDVK